MAIKQQIPRKIEPNKVAEGTIAVDDADEEEVPTIEIAALEAPKEIMVLVLRTISPAPTIGTCNLGAYLGVTRLEKDERYRVPRHVAATLQDSKAVAILA